LFKRIKISKEI